MTSLEKGLRENIVPPNARSLILLSEEEMVVGTGKDVFIQTDTDILHIMKEEKESMSIESVTLFLKEKFRQDFMSVIIVTIRDAATQIIYGLEQLKKICRMLKEREGLVIKKVTK